MGKHKREQISEFELEGQLLSFVIKDGYKVKYLHLATVNGDYTVKLCKEIRRSLLPTVATGDWLSVSGWQAQCYKTGQIKFKADQVRTTAPNSTEPQPIVESPALTLLSPQVILICQKSDCCKRGGRAVSEALQEVLSDRNLGSQVTLKPTGCMKRCKVGPNIVMPDKTRYSQVCPADLPTILDQHFPVQPQADVSGLSQDSRSVAPVF